MRRDGAPGQDGAGSAGALLRQWRDLRGLSQLDLALRTGVSQKHVSFVESGRSRPSPQMIIDLSDALDVPLRERNAILLAAGHAPRYSEAALDAPILSLSLGSRCLFRYGGTSRRDATRSFTLSSGDALVIGGPARMIFHGVDRIVPNTSGLLPNGGRINLTVRRVTV